MTKRTNTGINMGINDIAVTWAVRYCLGRMSYAVDDCSRWLCAVWDNMDESAKERIEIDIEEQFRRDDAARANGNTKGLPLGMDIDRASWERVRKLWSAK